MIKGYCKKQQNSECLAIVMVYHVTNRFLKKTKNLPLTFGYFHISVSSSTFLTASWLPIFVSAEPSWTILSIDRSERMSFECHTGGAIRKNFKNNGNFDIFCWLNFQLNQIQNCFVQIKKMKDRICSFQLKKKLLLPNVKTDDARHENVPPPLDLTRILKSYHKRYDWRKFLEK